MVERKLTGAHYGLRDWAMQRATAVIMLVYTWFFWLFCLRCLKNIRHGRHFLIRLG